MCAEGFERAVTNLHGVLRLFEREAGEHVAQALVQLFWHERRITK